VARALAPPTTAQAAPGRHPLGRGGRVALPNACHAQATPARPPPGAPSPTPIPVVLQ